MKTDLKALSLRDRFGKLLNTNKLAALVAMVLVLFIGGTLLRTGSAADNVPLALLSMPVAWLLIWGLLWFRRSGWKEFGLRRPQSWVRTVLFGLGGAVALHIIVGVILGPLIIRLTGQQVDTSRFDPLRGNLSALISGLVIVWTFAALGEEMIFRGYLMNRLAGLFKRKRLGWIVGLIISSVIFGLGHSYQGISGIMLTGIVGIVYALAYLAARCNLWVPILIHGIYDSSAFMFIFFSLDKTLTAFFL